MRKIGDFALRGTDLELSNWLLGTKLQCSGSPSGAHTVLRITIWGSYGDLRVMWVKGVVERIELGFYQH